MRLDADRFAAVVASTIKSALVKLEQRLEVLEQRGVIHGKDGAPGKDGKSVALADVEALVAKAVADMPKPADGKSITVDDVAPLIASEVAKAVGAIPVPAVPVSVVGTLVDRAGHLNLTLSDGTTKDIGPVVGRDGKDADPEMVARFVAEEVAKIPQPRDGNDGAPGRDGTLENLKAVYDGDGTLTFCFKDGTPVEGGVVPIPRIRYEGVYQAGKTYEPGMFVTWGGSLWHADETTNAKPGESSAESRAWRLAVKKGADGKQGPKGETGLTGKQGPAGPQGRNGY